jgi:PAS domain S-box-containing protein
MIYGSRVIKDGKVVGTRGIIVDISERKAMELALRKSEERYKKLIGSLQEGLFVIQEGKFTFLNDAIVKIVGYTVDELFGKEFLTVIASESKDMVMNYHYKRINGIESPDHYQTYLLHKNGASIPVILSVVLSDYEGKPAVIGTAKDISDWR